MKNSSAALQAKREQLLQSGVEMLDPAAVYVEENVTVGTGTLLLPGTILRGETSVGANCQIGPNTMLTDCTVEDGCLIGMGAILLNGCVIGAGSLVAAGALVTQNAVIPPGSLVMGSPAKAVRPLRPEERESLPHSAQLYRELSAAQLPAAGQEVTT